MREKGEGQARQGSGNLFTAPTTRRGFLVWGVAGMAGTVLPGPVFGAVRGGKAPSPGARVLSFYNTHTGERLTAAYREAGRLRPAGMAAIERILRDHRSGETVAIDPALLDLLYALTRDLRPSQPIHVISGYRSPETNASLRRRGRNVARNSFHMYGKAVDIRMPDVRLTRLRDAALDLARGGVGTYRHADFVHLDVGPVRSW